MIDTLQTLADTARTLRAGGWSARGIHVYLDRVITYADQQVRLAECAVAEAKRRYPEDWTDNIREPVGEDDEDWQLDQASHYGQGKHDRDVAVMPTPSPTFYDRTAWLRGKS